MTSQFRYKVDYKGRVFIPKNLREIVGESVVMSAANENCLNIYSKSEWDIISERLNKNNADDIKTSYRFFLTNTFEKNFDSKGRILIPKQLRLYCNMECNVVVIGNNKHVELWNENFYNSIKMPKELSQFGFVAED